MNNINSSQSKVLRRAGDICQPSLYSCGVERNRNLGIGSFVYLQKQSFDLGFEHSKILKFSISESHNQSRKKINVDMPFTFTFILFHFCLRLSLYLIKIVKVRMRPGPNSKYLDSCINIFMLILSDGAGDCYWRRSE